MKTNNTNMHRSKLKLYAALVLCTMSAALPATVMAECAEDWMQVDTFRNAETVELYANNSKEVPITITLQVWTKHMTADRPRITTETVPPNSSQLLMVLNNADSQKKSRYRFDCEWTIGSIDAAHDEDLLYRLPYATGKSYYVLQGYGSRLSHTGREQYTVDFNMREGTPIHAARGGIVAKTEESHSKGCWKDGCGKFANYIVILHDDWTTGEYYHLQKDGVTVEVGDRVVAGQMIGLSGNTGNSTMPHLHFGVYRAAAWGKYQSIPVQFSSIDGIVRKPRRGGRYQAVSIQSSASSKVEIEDISRSLH
jgi:murein DD-endopeptidase MepM/ murein hydrolase activator NlpD